MTPMTAAAPARPRLRSRRLLSARGRSLEITNAGRLFILLTLLVGFAAINSGSNLLHVLFGAQMALIIGSGVLSEGTVRKANARRFVVGSLHAGTPAPMHVEIENTGDRRELLSVSVEDDDREHARPTLRERWFRRTPEGEPTPHAAPVFAVRVPAAHSVRQSTTVVMPRRGRHRLPRAVVATRFPFGLFVKRRELGEPEEVIVFPAVHPLPRRASPVHRPPEQRSEGEHTGRVARVGEFFGLREYREGDDPRRIHWPHAARFAEPVMREHEAHGDTELVLSLAPGRTGDPAFEREVERIASIAVAELTRPGTAVGLRVDGVLVLPPASGVTQRLRLLERLALVGTP